MEIAVIFCSYPILHGQLSHWNRLVCYISTFVVKTIFAVLLYMTGNNHSTLTCKTCKSLACVWLTCSQIKRAKRWGGMLQSFTSDNYQQKSWRRKNLAQFFNEHIPVNDVYIMPRKCKTIVTDFAYLQLTLNCQKRGMDL